MNNKIKLKHEAGGTMLLGEYTSLYMPRAQGPRHTDTITEYTSYIHYEDIQIPTTGHDP